MSEKPSLGAKKKEAIGTIHSINGKHNAMVLENFSKDYL